VIHSLLVVRNGALVLEEYFHGYDRDDLHGIAACTKSVASLLIGVAIDRGRIEDVASPMLDFFPGERARAGEGWEQVTLEHVLTMSVGRSPEAWQRTGAVACAETPYHHVLTDDVTGVHGGTWRYGDRDVNLLAGVLLHATGRHADAFAGAALFEPLGIRTYDWSDGRKEGFPMMHGTLRLRPRDLAKLGALVLDDGTWRGRQIVSAEWIRASTEVRLRATRREDFGYLWWIARPGGADDAGLIFASGWGSQLLYVVPSMDVVVVLTGGNQFNGKTSAPWPLLVEHLFPAVRR
jgi:CubicO group peptidase (beta-lactamase class C family)